MKDEVNGRIITEFVGLRAKLYAFAIMKEDSSSHEVPMEAAAICEYKKKAKGMTKAAMSQISFDDFKTCLFNNKAISAEQRSIRSKNHNVFSLKQTKKGLDPRDDKRVVNYIFTDTLPWGYFSAVAQQQPATYSFTE